MMHLKQIIMINYGISISLPIFHIQTFEEDTSKETFPKNFKDVVGNSIQIMFNKRKLDKDDIVFINSFVKNHNLKYVFVHASYQINNVNRSKMVVSAECISD